MKWTAHIEGGPMRVNHAAVLVGSKIYSFGGYSSTDDFSDWQPIPVFVLETATMRWTQVKYPQEESDLPFERYGHSAVAYGHKVYLWGGRNNAVQCEMLVCYDTKTNEWSYPQVSGQIPFSKDGHAACLIRNKMYIFGGFEYHTDQFSQDLGYLDLDTMEWQCVLAEGSPPSHRDFHSAVGFEDKIYIFGGRGDRSGPHNSREEVYCPQLYILDTLEHKWTLAKPSGSWPGPRRSHSACKCPCTPASPDPETNDTEPNTGNSNKTEALRDNSDMHILDFAPSLKSLAICTVLENKLDQISLPRHIQMDIQAVTVRNRISARRETNQSG